MFTALQKWTWTRYPIIDIEKLIDFCLKLYDEEFYNLRKTVLCSYDLKAKRNVNDRKLLHFYTFLCKHLKIVLHGKYLHIAI